MRHEALQAATEFATELVAVEDQIARLEAVRRTLRDNLAEELAGMDGGKLIIPGYTITYRHASESVSYDQAQLEAIWRTHHAEPIELARTLKPTWDSKAVEAAFASTPEDSSLWVMLAAARKPSQPAAQVVIKRDAIGNAN